MNNKQKTILYIEDNPLNRRLVYKMLSATGHNILLADDGLTGQRKVKETMPDLILLDINLPDIDGLSIARHLKSQLRYRHIPIVAVTANSMHGDRDQCLVAGCDDYLAKPIMRFELINAVKKYIGIPNEACKQISKTRMHAMKTGILPSN